MVIPKGRGRLSVLIWLERDDYIIFIYHYFVGRVGGYSERKG